MRKLILFITILFIMSSCDKKQCWDTTVVVYTYKTTSLEYRINTWSYKEIICDKTFDEMHQYAKDMSNKDIVYPDSVQSFNVIFEELD